MGYSLRELRGKTDEELIEQHDHAAQHLQPGVNYFLQELARRDSTRQIKAMTDMTLTVKRLTWVIAGLTLANVVAAFN